MGITFNEKAFPRELEKQHARLISLSKRANDDFKQLRKSCEISFEKIMTISLLFHRVQKYIETNHPPSDEEKGKTPFLRILTQLFPTPAESKSIKNLIKLGYAFDRWGLHEFSSSELEMIAKTLGIHI